MDTRRPVQGPYGAHAVVRGPCRGNPRRCQPRGQGAVSGCAHTLTHTWHSTPPPRSSEWLHTHTLGTQPRRHEAVSGRRRLRHTSQLENLLSNSKTIHRNCPGRRSKPVLRRASLSPEHPARRPHPLSRSTACVFFLARLLSTATDLLFPASMRARSRKVPL